jgi:hypothetical protein
MTLPGLFGMVAAFGVACGVVLLLFVRPMRRLEESRAPMPVEATPRPELGG